MKKRLADMIYGLDREKIAWMWSDALPYNDWRKPAWMIEAVGPTPTILRGSRTFRDDSSASRRRAAARFVGRAARMLKLTTLDARPLGMLADSIIGRAEKRWPSVRYPQDFLILVPGERWELGRIVPNDAYLLARKAGEGTFEQARAKEQVIKRIAKALREIDEHRAT